MEITIKHKNLEIKDTPILRGIKNESSPHKNPYDFNGEAIEKVVVRKNISTKKVYIESYGCQMNFSDSEIVASILSEEGFTTIDDAQYADLVLLNTCSIRDKAEQTVRKRLEYFNALKSTDNKNLKLGVLGCMAERLKSKLLEEEKIVDMVVGPDAYKDLPNLLKEVEAGRDAVNVILSKDETYGDIAPVRLNPHGVSAFVTIMRGCDNMCTFCVVPFTRGRERSRSPYSILEEIHQLSTDGYKEVTLLGQNVDSYLWYGGGLKKDFTRASEMQKATAIHFSDLLNMVAESQPEIRIRFSTSNPQDITEDVLHTMAKHHSICKYIHLPVQSGSDTILKKMNRLHTRQQYFDTIDKIREIVPDCAISHDMITGFPTETEADHQDTLSLMDYVRYDFGYMFAYSERPGTMAAKKMDDNIPENIKKRRLSEIIALQKNHSLERMQQYVGKIHEILVDGDSKKSKAYWRGRNSQNAVIVFPKDGADLLGKLVHVKADKCTSATLMGERVQQMANLIF